jgi:hypothetical protein
VNTDLVVPNLRVDHFPTRFFANTRRKWV